MRKMAKLVESLTRVSIAGVLYGVVAQEIWKTIIELDVDDHRLLRDEAINEKHRKKEKKHKAKRRRKSAGQKMGSLKGGC